MRYPFLLLLLIASAVAFSQTAGNISLDSIGIQQPSIFKGKIKSFKNSPFLGIAAKDYHVNLDMQPGKIVQRSILAYDLKPLPSKPYFDFSDRNQFEAIYKTYNLAFYEALKNTALSQTYNPFSPHKQL